ncbi:amidohydrolase family protein [Pseudalkalibacillus decolorationis]|uniref:amidohydrolase family protein n=1 Tax=Pseudalkalibacillus decolorationis TaxID=163879 RepID=UPI0021488DCB|nr:amidohydrolase family protein [Pseudalkalibacillus decolorationis]
MVNAINEKNSAGSTKTKQLVIDSDVHSYFNSIEELVPYCDESLQKRLNIGPFKKKSFNGKVVSSGEFRFPECRYINPGSVLRLDAFSPNGSIPGADPEFVAKDLFDRSNTVYGVLNSANATMGAFHNVEIANEFNSVYNNWQYENWIEKDARYKMSMLVTPLDPVAAVKEIERIGKKPGVVAINLQTTSIPLGKRHFYPIYEIAEAYGLPILMHPDSESSGENGPAQAVGPASTYMEWHACLGLIAQRNIASLVCEGVFERFPKLKFVFAEYGMAWLPGLMWRLDKNWKALRDEVPWLKNRPSEYIRRNVRLGTQPIEEPFRSKDLLEVIQMAGAEDMLLYSSDYPHWDGDEADRVFNSLPKDLKNKIFYENALNTYNFNR